MLSVPQNMQPTLDNWNKTRNLEGAARFSGFSDGSQYLQRMDQVVLADNGDNDADPRPGVLVCKDDQETHRFTGNSQQGSLESVTADGSVFSLHIDRDTIDNLQLTQKPGGGVEALHEHFDRNGGKNWMAVGGAVTVIDMDQNPNALADILLGKPSAEKTLETKLGADANVTSRDERKGFNAGNCGFPVKGELQMSAWTEGLEIKFEAGSEKFVYRGLDETTGRFGLDVEHEGFWKQDERGIYVPDKSASEDLLW